MNRLPTVYHRIVPLAAALLIPGSAQLAFAQGQAMPPIKVDLPPSPNFNIQNAPEKYPSGELSIYGLRKPKNHIPGTDVSGTVEAVGKDVQGLRPGDEVLGWCAGAFAEYARAPENQLVKKPANLTFEQAAAVGVSATTALQLLRDEGHVQPGQKVLINGASGGVGTFAVQIAKAFGAEVTGVCSAKNVEMVRSLGADHVIDYTNEDFTKCRLCTVAAQ